MKLKFKLIGYVCVAHAVPVAVVRRGRSNIAHEFWLYPIYLVNPSINNLFPNLFSDSCHFILFPFEFFFSSLSTKIGTTNAPEYYINMRTGTHYFPRGVNGVAAVERSRQKFGLNKIEETVGETMCTTSITNSTSGSAIISNHRRTESCDLGKHQRQSSSSIFKSNNSINSISGNNNGNGVATSILSKEVSSLLQANNTHSRMSPDLQRHLAYQTYRGFECKSLIQFTICLRLNHIHISK